MELLIKTLEILRFKYGFGGYIHLKLIPNSDPYYIQKATSLANRVSSNIELPSKKPLELSTDIPELNTKIPLFKGF